MSDVGRYRVTRRIGQGGMAEVLEGFALGEEGFRRRVAIKRMRPEQAADAAFIRMFLDEARIASQLHHANIVAVIDYGVSDDLPFQVLEFVDGIDASQLGVLGERAGAKLPVELALGICTDIAHALEHAHGVMDAEGRSLGIVHRDVSPANILISWTGDVKLTDFGIAFARGRAETTHAGVAKGTLLYMAPEQVMRGEVDGRTDVFGLGCVLHALVAGQSPLAGENTMADLVAGKPLSLDKHLPEDVEMIVARATCLSKRDRFASAGAMAEALGTAMARRIERDAKSLMREWLTKVHPAPAITVTRPKRGKLDGLFDLEMVAGGGAEGREFKMRPSAPVEVQPEPAPVVEAEETTDAQLEAGRRRARARIGIASGVAVVLVVVAIGLMAVLTSGATTGATTGAGAGKAPDAAPVASVASSAPVVPVPIVSTPAVSTPMVAEVKTTPTPAVRKVESRPAVAVASSAAPPPAPVGEGVVAIGGDGALRAEILVDGTSRGYAPKILSLAAGGHELVLVRPDGRKIGPHAVNVTAANTASAPVRWMVP